MNSNTSRKIIVASGMAVVVGTGLVIFALRVHSGTSVAQTPHPPAPVAQTPAAAPAAAAQIPAVPGAVAQVPDAPAAVAPSDSVGAKSADTATPSAVEPKLARSRHLAKASTSAAATNGTVTPTGSAADTREKPAAETVANSAGGVKSADELTTPPATGSSPADDQKVGTSAGVAASDSQITTDVKSEIAGDRLSKDVNIGVTTTQGIVALTGSLASQDAIDHFKDVAGKVPGVKSVDTSALVLASL
jgi:hyperosmotically inducible protein